MLRLVRVPPGLASCSRSYSFDATPKQETENKVVPQVTDKKNSQIVESKLKPKELWKRITPLEEFSLAYPDFLQSTVWNRRNPLYEELVRADMMERRIILDIPEFYVGSIVAVTLADKYLDSKKRRFLGICIHREKQMLHHTFTLRNIINGLGVEIMYDLYSPDIQKIEVIRLERRLDNDLSYLVDAQQQYSTFDMNMEALQSPLGKPVHINPIKVIMKPPPWTRRWELYNIKGIDEKSVWGQVLPFHKKKFIQYTKDTSYEYYDLIKHYREDGQEREHEMKVMAEMLSFEAEKEKLGVRAKRRILRANSKTHHHKWSIDEKI
uniref:Large ribosomal subunit protein bL19m n=1 Tax=Acrobeloides nanus TaxID=290746 RepID=A0A914C5E2_9BILA